jgi:hypothetical protein
MNARLDDLFEEHKPTWRLLSKGKLWDSIRKADGSLRRRDFEAWYKRPVTEEVFAPAKRTKRADFRRIARPPYSYQIDVVHMDNYASQNKGVTRFLLIVEVNSRKAWASPLKDGRMPTVLKAYRPWLRGLPETPLLVQGDNAFAAKEFVDYNASKNIPVRTGVAADEHVTTGDPLGTLDRLVRTLRALIEKRIFADDDPKWTAWLDEVVGAYNATPHGSLPPGATPDETYADYCAMHRVWVAASDHNRAADPPPFAVGDYVRTKKRKGTFEKSATKGWSSKVYTVASIAGNARLTIRGWPDGDPLQRAYKPNELLKIDAPRVPAPRKAAKSARKKSKSARALRASGLDEAAAAQVAPPPRAPKKALPRLRSQVPKKLAAGDWAIAEVLGKRKVGTGRKAVKEVHVRYEDTWETKKSMQRYAQEVDAVQEQQGKKFLVRWKTAWIPEDALSK